MLQVNGAHARAQKGDAITNDATINYHSSVVTMVALLRIYQT
jgi:hypothetical protein